MRVQLCHVSVPLYTDSPFDVLELQRVPEVRFGERAVRFVDDKYELVEVSARADALDLMSSVARELEAPEEVAALLLRAAAGGDAKAVVAAGRAAFAWLRATEEGAGGA